MQRVSENLTAECLGTLVFTNGHYKVGSGCCGILLQMVNFNTSHNYSRPKQFPVQQSLEQLNTLQKVSKSMAKTCLYTFDLIRVVGITDLL